VPRAALTSTYVARYLVSEAAGAPRVFNPRIPPGSVPGTPALGTRGGRVPVALRHDRCAGRDRGHADLRSAIRPRR